MELKDKTAIVTGSGRGIGEGIALVLAREGANVVINDRTITKDAEGVVQKIISSGGKAIAVGADVSKKAEVTAMAAGCMWNGADQECAGTADACEDISAQAQCEFQGCTWGDATGLTCMGTATECSSITAEAECTAQPGCSFE